MYLVTLGIIGTGIRAYHLFKLIKQFSPQVEIAALCDTSEHRLRNFAKLLDFNGSLFTNSEHLLMNCTQVNTILITTPDNTHEQLSLQSIEYKKHTLCEKPLAQSIQAATLITEKVKGNQLVFTVGHVLRYTNFYQTVKRYIDDGLIGQVRVVTAHDLVNGAKYFRRWHRYSHVSGGILLHKSIHTFDLLAWFLGNAPVRLSAAAKRKVFVPIDHQERYCRNCDLSPSCRFWFDLNISPYRELYLETETNEHADIRDVCAFNSSKDIVDHATVLFEFPDTLVNYTLSLFSPAKTRRFLFIGELGELECDEADQRIDIRRFGRRPMVEHIPPGNDSGHFGGDYGLLAHFFNLIKVKDFANDELLRSLTGLTMAVKAVEAVQHPGGLVLC